MDFENHVAFFSDTRMGRYLEAVPTLAINLVPHYLA